MRGNSQSAQITIRFVQSPGTGMGTGGFEPLRQNCLLCDHIWTL